MEIGILGKKVGMTRVFDDKGTSIPVTVISAGPCKVTQLKTSGSDSYTAVQIGFEAKGEKHLKKPLAGHYKKAGISPLKYLREFRLDHDDALTKYQLGQEIKVDIFKAGDFVDVIGYSKGRGFQGVVKRHGFKGTPAGHGNAEYFRRPGSIGTNTFGSNVKRGKKFPGHYGVERNTMMDLKVVRVETEDNLLLVRGSVPGANGGFLVVRKTNRG